MYYYLLTITVTIGKVGITFLCTGIKGPQMKPKDFSASPDWPAGATISRCCLDNLVCH